MFLHLLLIVLVDVEEVRRIKPCHREKVVLPLPREFFPKTAQMYPKGIFPRNIVHTEKVVHTLPWHKCAKPFWGEASIIEPVDVPGSIVSFALVRSTYEEIAGSLLGSISLGGAASCVLIISKL